MTADLLARTEKLRRITIKALGDETGELALLEQQLHKMPKIKYFIETVVESEKQYRKRRVQYVIKLMQENEEPICEWRVKRQAGIKQKYYWEVETFDDLKGHVT